MTLVAEQTEILAAIARSVESRSNLNRALNPVANAALETDLTEEDRHHLGILCDEDGSFIFRHFEFAIRLIYQGADGPFRTWTIAARDNFNHSVEQTTVDLRYALITFLANLSFARGRR